MNDGPEFRPILVFAYGNPSRGDDALGPLLIERLKARQRKGQLRQVDCLTDFQPQVEHALDMRGRAVVVFVDAAADGPEPFLFEEVVPAQDVGYSTHAMTPGAVLRAFGQVADQDCPSTRSMAIRGYAFDLGRPISEAADTNLGLAFERLSHFLENTALGIR